MSNHPGTPNSLATQWFRVLVPKPDTVSNFMEIYDHPSNLDFLSSQNEALLTYCIQGS